MTSPPPPQASGSWRPFGLFAAALSVAYAWVLWRLFQLSRAESLDSHVFLIPAISFYFAWLRRHALPARSTPAWPGAILCALVALTALAAHFGLAFSGRAPAPRDSLALLTFSYLAGIVAGGFVFLGLSRMKALVFPFAFLIFMVPLPGWLVEAVEWFLQHGSAEVTAIVFNLTSTPNFREGLIFKLPGITLKVAQECSGIRSTYVLFITCLAAGYLLLSRPWTRAVMALVVIPLGLVRNAIRIYVIAQLCIHQGPHMIDSRLHREGGPIFFALALIPLFIILFLLRKAEKPRKHQPQPSV